MNKSISAAIASMLLLTASAWANTPEGQAIRPTGDNQPDAPATERADEQPSRGGEQSVGNRNSDRTGDNERAGDSAVDDAGENAGEARGGNQDSSDRGRNLESRD